MQPNKRSFLPCLLALTIILMFVRSSRSIHTRVLRRGEVRSSIFGATCSSVLQSFRHRDTLSGYTSPLRIRQDYTSISSSQFDEPPISPHSSWKRGSRRTSQTQLDTIYALSSGPLVKTGVSVIRISGSHASTCLRRLCKPTAVFPEPRRASLRRLYCPQGQLLDQAIALWFPGPNSFTGEDIVELHVHGSRAVILGVFEALNSIDGSSLVGDGQGNDTTTRNDEEGESKNLIKVRPAERGEFTRRAFDNGRMDLTEVEGLADLLEADTSEQRKQALRQLEGHLRVTYEGWRQELVGCLAHTEAVIDFGDDDREDDVNDDAMWALTPRVAALKSTLEAHLHDGQVGEIIREGVKIALAGPPNAGKSSLMNALARRPAAIVSPIAGTTRDVVEVRMDLAGVTCIVSDTAGLREDGGDVIEMEGMVRARRAFEEAHIKIFVSDASDKASVSKTSEMLANLLTQQSEVSGKSKDDDNDINSNEMEKEEEEEEEEGGGGGGDSNSLGYRVLIVLNKADLLNDPDSANELESALISNLNPSQSSLITSSVATAPTSKHSNALHRISCTTGKGLQEFEESLKAAIKSLLESGGGVVGGGAGKGGSEGVLITRQRHRRHLKSCVGHLERFLSHSLPMDAAAEELRLAAMELGRVTGRVDVEELLDIIFRDFCIGK